MFNGHERNIGVNNKMQFSEKCTFNMVKKECLNPKGGLNNNMNIVYL